MTEKEAIRIYIDAAKEALESAQYNLDGGFDGVAVNLLSSMLLQHCCSLWR